MGLSFMALQLASFTDLPTVQFLIAYKDEGYKRFNGDLADRGEGGPNNIEVFSFSICLEFQTISSRH